MIVGRIRIFFFEDSLFDVSVLRKWEICSDEIVRFRWLAEDGRFELFILKLIHFERKFVSDGSFGYWLV